MKSPWKSIRPTRSDHDHVALASSIPPRSRASKGASDAGASAAREQLADTDGVIGFSLPARPFRELCVTLSIWEDQSALETVATSEPHAQPMAELGPEMAPTTLARWSISSGDARPSWRDALQRLSSDS